MQIIQILLVEGTERGFDRWAEAGYALPNVPAEKRRPDAGLEENFWRTDRGGAARMKLAVQFRAMSGRHVIEKFRSHLSVTTGHCNRSDWETQAERGIGKTPNLS